MRAALLFLVLLQDAESHLASAREKAGKGDLDGAIAECTRAIEADPKSPEAYFFRAVCRIQKKDQRAALPDLDKVIGLAGKSENACGYRGVTRFETNDYAGAIADLTDALQINPGMALYRGIRGVAHYYQLEFREAVSDLSMARHDGRKGPGLLLVRGRAYYALESWDNALRDFREEASIDPARISEMQPWIWAARARSGDREGASEEVLRNLLTLPETREKGMHQGLARYLLGHLSEEEILKGAEEPEEARKLKTCDARFFIATKELLDHKEAAALESLHAAMETGQKQQGAWIAAKAEMDARHVRQNRRAMDAVEARFRTLKRCHAEFQLRYLTPDGQEVDKDSWATCSMDLDRETNRFAVTFPEGFKDFPKGAAAYFEKNVAWYWEKGGEATKLDFTPFFDQMERWETAALAELDRLVPAPPKAREPSAQENAIILVLDGRPEREQQGSFRFSIGRGTYPCSWTREGLHQPDTNVREEGDEIVVEIPSRRKTVGIDKATGFIRRIEARDHDGKIRRLLRTSFAADAPFPKVEIPARVRPGPLDPAAFRTYSENHIQTLSIRVSEAVERWSAAVRAGKAAEVRDLFVRWLTQYMETVHQSILKRAAGQYLQWLLNQGIKMDDLRKEADEHLKNFRAGWAKGRTERDRFMQDHLDELGRKVAADLIEEPIDSRLHPALFKIRKQVFDFDRVEAGRKKDDDAKVDRAFREELEAARQL